MGTTPATGTDSISVAVDSELARAEQKMYDAETALHSARQTGVDAWVSAAYDRLHEAILAHDIARETAPVV